MVREWVRDNKIENRMCGGCGDMGQMCRDIDGGIVHPKIAQT